MEGIPQQETRERKPRRIFVEIGTNKLAVPWLGENALHPDDIYIGVDIDAEDLSGSKTLTKGHKKMGDKTLFAQADAEHMPIKAQSVHEVFFGNVLGDPSISAESKDRFIGEARRIVAQDGRVVVKENNTPAEIAGVRTLLAKHHLKVERVVESGSPEWPEAVRRYHRPADDEEHVSFRSDDYIIYAIPDTEL